MTCQMKRQSTHDSPPDYRDTRRLRFSLLLGAMASVKNCAVKGVAGGESSRGAHLTAAGRLRNAQ